MSTHIFNYIDDSQRFGYGKYLDVEIVIDSNTKYINASKICKQNGKKLSEWLRYDSSKELIESWSNINRGGNSHPYYDIDRTDVVGMQKADQDKILGKYFHEDLLIMIAQWVSKDFAFKVGHIINTYRTALSHNVPMLNNGLPSFITDKISVNIPLNALNDLIGHQKRELTESPKAKMMKIETYGEILSRKVRALYTQIMPSDYYDLIKDIAHPEDIREVLICIAGKLGIDIIVKEEEQYGIKTYEVYFQWNKLPILLGYTDDERQAQIRAGDWKYQGWINKEALTQYKDLKSNVRSKANIRNDTVYVRIDGLTKLLCKCEALGHKNDILQTWIDTTLKVSKYYSHLASEAHAEYNANYASQLRDLHYREIKAITDIPMPTLTKGYLYIGTDPSHLAKCEYKLGMTSKPVKTRLSSSQTTNPEYYYIYSVETKEPHEAEHILHTLLTRMGMKITKEWFRIPSEEAAITLVNKIVEIVGCVYDDEYIDKFIQSIRALHVIA